MLVGLCKQHFSVRTGPARNFAAPSGEADHVFTYDPKWSKSGTVKFANHPDEYLMGIRRMLAVDPNTAGVYDTVYVDLDGDYNFKDEKPVTQSVARVLPRHEQRRDHRRLRWAPLLRLWTAATRIPGGVTSFGVNDRPGAGDLLAWTGDFDPGIEGHGT